MRFGVLGPVVLFENGIPVHLASFKQRMLLAVLLRHSGRAVSKARLTEALWPAAPPASAEDNLRVYVHHLRHSLGDQRRITRIEPGYALTVYPGELDVQYFEDLLKRGRDEARSGSPEKAAATLRAAQDLWRGHAYEGLGENHELMEETARLEDLRLSAAKERISLELSLGRQDVVISELRELIDENPLHEGFRAQLMLALYRSGRQAESLEVYQNTRTKLVDELGIDPGPELRQLESAILAGDPGLRLHPPARGAVNSAVPAELPVEVPELIGRTEAVSVLCGHFASPGTGRVRIAAIDGPGGVGKSALAVCVAHRVAACFPDGQLYVDLRGSTPDLEPLATAEVLVRFLRALGASDAGTHQDEAEAAARFRSLTCARKVLIVLDNAFDAAQIRPLLPSGASCAVLITARRVLATLDGALRLRADPLTQAGAMDLLDRLAGGGRVAEETGPAAEIVRLCGGLPLALRVVGARLAANPSWSLQSLAQHIERAHNPLDELDHSDLSVRATFAVGLQANTGACADVTGWIFAHLGLLRVPEVSAPLLAAICDRDVAEVQPILDRLAESRLLESPTVGRYGAHDLIRAYAREQAESLLTSPERQAATSRGLHWYLGTARSAAYAIGATPWRSAPLPGEPPLASRGMAVDQESAGEWFDHERDSLVAAIRHMAEDDAGSWCHVICGLTAALFPLFEMRGGQAEWIAVHELAVDAARATRYPGIEARMLTDLAWSHVCANEPERALSLLTKAITLWSQADDESGRADTLNSLGCVQGMLGLLEESVASFETSAAVRRGQGDSRREAATLNNLGVTYRKLTEFDKAIATYERCLATRRELGDALGEMVTLGSLGETYRQMGEPERAVGYFEQAIAAGDATLDRTAQATILWGLGDALSRLGDDRGARARWEQSLVILKDMGEVGADDFDAILNDPSAKCPDLIRRII